MPDIHIHQIFYSDQTRRELDAGFIPLDNSANERPDWREYWPIRKFLLGQRLVPGDYYGFLSPKFWTKTRLTAPAVHQFVRLHVSAADVMLFSPYFDQSVFFTHIVEQAVLNHPDTRPVFEGCLEMIAPDFRIASTLSSSRSTVFCNYFVARAEFWLRWFEACEQIFAIAERGATPLARGLNAGTRHGIDAAPVKVFVIERIASMLLAREPHWKVRPYNPMLLPMSPAKSSTLRTELIVLDALKLAYEVQGFAQYRDTYLMLRQRFLDALK